jgi:transposase InsO family protein
MPGELKDPFPIEAAGESDVVTLVRIRGAKRRGRRTTTLDARRAAARLVQRDFTAPAPDRLWVCDFIYLRCW